MPDFRISISGSLDIGRTVTEINAQLSKVQSGLNTIDISDTKGIKKWTTEINNANKLAKAMSQAELGDQQRVNAAKIQGVQQEIAARRQALELTRLQNNEAKATMQQQTIAAKAVAAENKKAFSSDKLTSDIATAQYKLQAFAKKYSAIMNDPNLKAEWSGLVDQASLITSKEQLSAFNSEFAKFNQKVAAAGKATRSWGQELANNIGKMASWMILGGLIASVSRQLKAVYTNVVAVNTAMTELKKVTNESDESYSKFLDRTSNKAVEMSAGVADLVTSTANFARLGYSMEDAEMLGQVAVMYKNVGDGVDSVDTATQTVISTMHAFNIQAKDSETIIDKLNEVGRWLPMRTVMCA